MKTAQYEMRHYLLEDGAAGWQEFIAKVREALPAAAAETGAEIVALFGPKIGFAANEALLLLRRGGPVSGDSDPVARVLGPEAAREALVPTLRPADDDRPQPGGIYAHRWFTVASEDVDEFLRLSGEAWSGFEGGFDSQIFGLFRAERSDGDRAAGVTRLLLVTRYASHAVWEASREPDAKTKQLFRDRHALTRHTIVRTSVLIPLGA